MHLIDNIKIKNFQADRLTHLHNNTHCSYKRVYLQNQIFTFALQERFVNTVGSNSGSNSNLSRQCYKKRHIFGIGL